ncbi:amino acid adenylation domain-containing protein [Salinispora arenicola]|uniref:amino acid adenylation domain-containing protein n=1 Tax=Salinispora arenicola TaxID=168697 RepID=UPI00037E185D|nr:amino acid adenylation domain-containing protein [Salinispora arenicola]
MTTHAPPDTILPLPGATCHSLVIRLDDDPERVRERLTADATRRPELSGLKLWETRSPAHSADSAAHHSRDTEAARPLRAGAFPLRAVLLRHVDDVHDLVLVADRARVSLPSLRLVASLLKDGTPVADAAPLLDAAPVAAPRSIARPTWGLADRDAPARWMDGTPTELTLPADVNVRTLIAATASTLARYGGDKTVQLGILDTTWSRVPRILTLETHDDQDLATLLAQTTVRGREQAEHDALPEVGIIRGDVPDDGQYVPCLAPLFPLTLQVSEQSDGTLAAWVRFDERAVADGIARQFCAHLLEVAADFADGPDERRLAGIDPLMGDRAREILTLGGLDAPRPVRGLIHRRFVEVAGRRPDMVCLTAGDTRLTYRELDDRAEQSAAGLRAVGVAPGDLVGVCLERVADLVVTLLAVLKTGAAYVPMDPRHPEERLRYTVEDAELSVVVTTLHTFPRRAGTVLVSPTELVALAAGALPAVPQPSDPDRADRAYVIYTSGSTGHPKGVVVPHWNVLALVEATAADFGLGSDDTWTLFHSSAFDFSVWEIWGCLLTGGHLVVVPYWVTRDADEFCQLLSDEQVTVLNQTPSAFTQLIGADQRLERALALRLIIFGGEPLDAGMLAPWFARHSSAHCRVVNMFGITETTVHVTAHTVTPHDVIAGSRSVGRPLAGWHASVRDEHGRLLPPGAPGELYVGGAGVAECYLRKPELTEQRFVSDPLTGERVYRSGDRGRMRPDGSFDHLGRLDNQVKVRGYRIELDEVRAVLLAVSGISAAAVVVRQDDPADPASKRIDGYVAATGSLDLDAVHAHVRAVLPDYMVPSTLMVLADIPLTINGKLDESRLPDPRTTALGSPDVAAANPKAGGPTVGERIFRIWSTLLKTEVGPEDNFFKLGGNSLLVIQAITALQADGLPKVSPRDFYANSTAHRFVALVDKLVTAA